MLDRSFLLNIWRRFQLRLKKLSFWLLVTNRVARFLRLPLVTTSLPAMTGIYVTARQVYQDRWPFFSHYEGLHDHLLFAMMMSTIAVVLFKAVADTYIKRFEGGYIDLLQNFIIMSGNIVNIKDLRFKRVAGRILPGEDFFLEITHPGEQINAILAEAKHFISKSFGLNPDSELRITIIEQQPDGVTQWVFDTQPSWTRMPLEELLEKESAAADCLRTGEQRFYPDKEVAASQGRYYLSERDGRLKGGSVYCCPVFIEANNKKWRYVITFITYENKRLCGGYNNREIERIGVLFREVCRRLELELTLRVLKSLKLDSNLGQGSGNGNP